MDQFTFWQLIEQAKAASGDDVAYQVELVKKSLRTLPLADIETFERIYQEFYDSSFSLELQDAYSQFADVATDDGVLLPIRWQKSAEYMLSRIEPLPNHSSDISRYSNEPVSHLTFFRLWVPGHGAKATANIGTCTQIIAQQSLLHLLLCS